MMLVSAQWSFGTGNETCCPDTTSTAIATTSSQMQMDLLQEESHHMAVTLPSLGAIVASKLQSEQYVMNVLQAESQKVEVPSFGKQLDSKLGNRLAGNSKIEPVKF